MASSLLESAVKCCFGELVGGQDAAIYDGGWNTWQMDSKYLVQKCAEKPPHF
ncbi:hypothetical protein [Avibacterium volantium]|uniref:hypothetical protein n=1 Tax=Avibacterium volantium TaxID=762 RepID=UPI003BF8321F